MTTDPIADMINTLKNAGTASKESIVLPYSKIKQSIADCLLKAGYVKSVSKKTRKGFPALEIGLQYLGKDPRVTDVKRISKPSRRMYMGVKEIRPFKNGHGMTVLSTPKGILSDKDARKEMVGGEILFTIW
ncbi:MAG: 30S ribosomal protein S8 [Candidatus Pacebacteria bacterium]|jgi:small subunit ribosomal protein S8|nr:30S ribosomal protein S8 [Candidatus Paceibacterota bacterium]